MVNQNPNKRKMPTTGAVEGVLKIARSSELAQEFITVGKSFEEALGRCSIRDDEQRNAIIIYKAQLDLFDMTNEVQDLTNWINAGSAIGGFNRSLAAMVGTGIYYPVGAGIKVGKEDQKALMEIQKQREGRRNGEQEKQQQQQ